VKGPSGCIISPQGILELEIRDYFKESITQQMQSTEILLCSVAAAEL